MRISPKKVLSILAALTAMLLAGGCGRDLGGSTSGLSGADDFKKFEHSRFGFFRAQSSLPFVKELGVHWDRPHPGPFIWGEIEKEEGSYDFSGADAVVREDQKYAVLTVATIWPYANWDQERCRQRLPDDPRRLFSILGDYRGKPCDPGAYRRFVEALVERYDGDGDRDMPGLVYPIKYWEVSNEPDITEGAIFFKGDPQSVDYLDLLSTTQEGIREADPEARIMNGGIALLAERELPFWRAVLGEGARYIDIVTLHSITLGEDLQMPALRGLMDELALDRPVWVTEIQFAKSKAFLQARGISPEAAGGTFGPQNLTEEEWSSALVTAFVEAFGRGAEKLFYLGLDNTTPTAETSLLVTCQLAEGATRGDPFDPALCRRQKPFYAFRTMVDEIDYFDYVEKLEDGRFRFSVGGRQVYVLWGEGPLPSEIAGDFMVAVTDVQGNRKEMPARTFVLTDVPVFVERMS